MSSNPVVDALRIDVEQAASQLKPVDRNVQKLLDSRDKVRRLGKNPAPLPKPIVVFSDGLLETPLFFPNTINTIKGKTGEQKSGYAEHLATLFASEGGLLCDTLGHECRMDEQPTVVYLDSERDEDTHLPYIQQRIVTRAGFDAAADVEHLHLCSIATVDRKERVRALLDTVVHLRKTIDGKIVVICDQIIDFVINMLDAQETMPLFDELLRVCKLGVTIFCVIHENPGTDKARGHVGTELINKSFTVMQVGSVRDSSGKKTGNFRIHMEKNRMHEAGLEIIVRYDKESKGLVQVSKEVAQAERERSETRAVDQRRQALLNCLGADLVDKTLKQKELFACVKERGEAKNEKEWVALLAQISNQSEKYPVVDVAGNEYRLLIGKDGLATTYSLELSRAANMRPIFSLSTDFPAQQLPRNGTEG